MEQQKTHFLFITKLGWLGLSVPPSNKVMQLILQKRKTWPWDGGLALVASILNVSYSSSCFASEHHLQIKMVRTASQSRRKSLRDFRSGNLVNPTVVTTGNVNNNKNSLFFAAAMSQESVQHTHTHTQLDKLSRPDHLSSPTSERPCKTSWDNRGEAFSEFCEERERESDRKQ